MMTYCGISIKQGTHARQCRSECFRNVFAAFLYSVSRLLSSSRSPLCVVAFSRLVFFSSRPSSPSPPPLSTSLNLHHHPLRPLIHPTPPGRTALDNAQQSSTTSAALAALLRAVAHRCISEGSDRGVDFAAALAVLHENGGEMLLDDLRAALSANSETSAAGRTLSLADSMQVVYALVANMLVKIDRSSGQNIVASLLIC